MSRFGRSKLLLDTAKQHVQGTHYPGSSADEWLPKFAKLDRDSDGKLSRIEFQASANDAKVQTSLVQTSSTEDSTASSGMEPGQTNGSPDRCSAASKVVQSSPSGSDSGVRLNTMLQARVPSADRCIVWGCASIPGKLMRFSGLMALA